LNLINASQIHRQEIKQLPQHLLLNKSIPDVHLLILSCENLAGAIKNRKISTKAILKQNKNSKKNCLEMLVELFHRLTCHLFSPITKARKEKALLKKNDHLLQANIATLKSELALKMTAKVNDWWSGALKTLEECFEPDSLSHFKLMIFEQLVRILRDEGTKVYEGTVEELSDNLQEMTEFLVFENETFKLRLPKDKESNLKFIEALLGRATDLSTESYMADLVAKFLDPTDDGLALTINQSLS